MVLGITRAVRLASDLPPAALAERLGGVVGGERAPFSGRVGSDRFVITRVREHRNAFMPLMRGTLAPRLAGGTLVSVRLRPAGTVLAFMAIWLTFLAAVAGLIAAAHALDARRSLLPLLAPAGLALCSWFLTASVFKADARAAVDRLLEAVPALRPDGGPPRN